MEHALLLFFSYFVEAIIVWQYTANLFVPKHTVKPRLLFLTVLYAIMFVFSLFRLSYLNASLFLGMNMLFFSTQFWLTWSNVLFHTAMLTAIMGISELAAIGGVSRLFPHFVSTQHTGLFFYGVLSKSLYFMAVYILTHLFRQKSEDRESYGRSGFLLILIPVSSVFVMFTFLYIGEMAPFVPPADILVTISAVFLLLMNLLVFGINQYHQKKSREFMEMQLLLQKEADTAEYYAMLLSLNENQSILLHDLKKHLQSIELLNEQGETDQISAYIRSLMDTSDWREASRVCDHAMLNAILGCYQRSCHEKGIHFHVDIRANTLGHLSQNDQTSLFCNLLDNAVEAAGGIPDAFIELTVQKKENSLFTVIVVINSCRSEPAYDKNGLPFSHKQDKSRHGFGVKSIQKVVKQYQGNMRMYYDNDSATFHTVITLKQ